MSFKRSTSKAVRLVALALLTTVSVSACVGSYTEYYDDEYNPEERTVVVKHTRPIYRRVDVYDTRPTVVYTGPKPNRYYRHHTNHYYSSTYAAPPSTTAVIVRKNKPYYGEQTVILNPGQHQQQKVIVRPYGQQHNTTVVKPYRDHNQSYNGSTTVVKPYSQQEDTTVIKRYRNNSQSYNSSTTVDKPYKQQENITILKRYNNSPVSQYQNNSQTVIASPAPPSTTIVKSHHYNKTHEATPPSNAEVKHSKKIVIESPGDAPPSTLAE